jgi:hypothetical protein
MKWIWIIGVLLGLAGIVGVRSRWFRANGEAEHIPDVVEPIENFLPTGPATRPVPRVNPLARVTMSADYRGRALNAVVDDIAATARVSVVADWRAIESAGVAPTTPVTLRLVAQPASTVLASALRLAGGRELVYWIEDDGVLRVGVDGQAPFVLRIYNIRDILVDSVRFQRALTALPTSSEEERRKLLDPNAVLNDLMELITNDVDRYTWVSNGGKCGTLNYIGGKLVIAQTEENHARIEGLLAKLRQK